jgi:hypothetical protein
MPDAADRKELAALLRDFGSEYRQIEVRYGTRGPVWTAWRPDSGTVAAVSPDVLREMLDHARPAVRHG